jgi:predicted PurR-regulated permease PerM
MNRETVNKSTLLLLLFGISAIFLSMIRYFLMAIFLAGIFSALVGPLYKKFLRWFGNRRALSSFVTMLLIVFIIMMPLGMLIGIISTQAVHVGQSITPWVQKQLSEPIALTDYLRGVPFADQMELYKEPIIKKAGELVGKISKFLLDSMSSLALGTVNFLFMFFIFLYTMFYFLMEGDRLLLKILYYLPLEDHDEQRILEKFTSVTRATVKGTIIIGILQGGLAGVAFAVVGISSAVFWGTVMTVLSIIPAVGSGLVWFPASVILLLGGDYMKATGLIIFCGVLVGSLDNVLRPRLVGRDIQMHDLMILFGTLGGMAMFGILGFIIGPIIAALFVTLWEIYGHVFKDVLPVAGPVSLDTLKNTHPENPPNKPETVRKDINRQ